MARRFAAVLVSLLSWSGVASADDSDAAFERGRNAVADGRYNDAIVELERLSDRGIRDANASFNRALAYLGRAEGGNPKEGDLGQAAAAFREATILGDATGETRQALERVRQAISRQRASRGLDPVVVRPALGRALLQLVPEIVWAILAAVASIALAVGLWLRDQSASARTLAGQVVSASGGVLLVVCAVVSFFAERLRSTEKEAVVVTTEAPILDAAGTRQKSRALDIDATAIPEGASVYVSEQQGRLVRVHWGSTMAWVEIGRVRLVSRNLEL